jgi:hypothetical protein
MLVNTKNGSISPKMDITKAIFGSKSPNIDATKYISGRNINPFVDITSS